METERITLSQRERDRLKVLHEVKQKHLSQVAAAERQRQSRHEGADNGPRIPRSVAVLLQFLVEIGDASRKAAIISPENLYTQRGPTPFPIHLEVAHGKRKGHRRIQP